MTTSLLQGLDWFNTCPPGYRESAYQQIVDSLERKPFTSKAMDRGQAYEDSIDVDAPPAGLELLTDSIEQPWMKAFELKCKIGTFVFRGKIDYLKRGPSNWRDDLVIADKTIQKWADNKEPLIIDLKTTKRYFKQGYLNKRQHAIYGLAEDIPNFVYATAVFEGIAEPHNSLYLVPTAIKLLPIKMDLVEEKIKLTKAVDDFMDWLVSVKLFNTYMTVYNK